MDEASVVTDQDIKETGYGPGAFGNRVLLIAQDGSITNDVPEYVDVVYIKADAAKAEALIVYTG